MGFYIFFKFRSTNNSSIFLNKLFTNQNFDTFIYEI